MMIANRTKVYLDVRGMKYHFFEPSSLRNMYDLFYILYNMNNIVEEYDNRKKEGNNYYLHRSQNRKRLLDYIHFTMRRDYCFDDKTSEFFDELIAYPIERRGQKIWGYFYQLLDSEGIYQRIDSAYGKNFIPTEKFFYKSENYSFGEFFRILYTSSRLGVFDHRLIKFILASYSMALPAFVENEKRIHKKEQYKHLVDLYGSSLIGINWCDELFGCRVEVYKKENQNYPDIVYKTQRCSIVVPIKNKRNVDILDLEMLVSLLLLSPHWVTEKAIEVEKNDNEWIIHAELDPTSFLINCLLINDKIRDKYDANKKTTKYGLKIFKYKNIIYTLSGLIQEIYGDLRLSNTKYLDYYSFDVKYDTEEIIDESGKKQQVKIPNNYINAYKDIITKIRNQSKVKKIIDIPFRDEKDVPVFEEKGNHKGKQIVNEGTITEVILDYLAQDYRAHHLANMLKHIDLIYNTIKRSITDIVYITSHDVIKKQGRFENAGEPANIINKFYTNLINQLEETDEIYFAEGVNASYSFSKRFNESAIVKNVRSMTNTSDKTIFLRKEPITDTSESYTTLKKVLDDISPINMYIEYLSEFMMAIRGKFAELLDDKISNEKAHSINVIILEHLSNITNYSLYDNSEKTKIVDTEKMEIKAIEDEKVENSDNEELVKDDEYIRKMNKKVLDEINDAKEKIENILNGEVTHENPT